LLTFLVGKLEGERYLTDERLGLRVELLDIFLIEFFPIINEVPWFSNLANMQSEAVENS
jgi:hypothetical protein